MKFEWEVIESEVRKDVEKSVYGQTCRAKVKGGWLIRYSCAIGVSMTFLADEYHSWIID